MREITFVNRLTVAGQADNLLDLGEQYREIADTLLDAVRCCGEFPECSHALSFASGQDDRSLGMKSADMIDKLAADLAAALAREQELREALRYLAEWDETKATVLGSSDFRLIARAALAFSDVPATGPAA